MYGNLRRRKKSPFRVFAGFAGYTTQCSGHVDDDGDAASGSGVCSAVVMDIITDSNMIWSCVSTKKFILFKSDFGMKMEVRMGKVWSKVHVQLFTIYKEKESSSPLSQSVDPVLFFFLMSVNNVLQSSAEKREKNFLWITSSHVCVEKNVCSNAAACYVCIYAWLSFYPNKFSIYYIYSPF